MAEICQKNKFFSEKPGPKTGQEGVTLLLAILILSSILAISFSVATILLIEVRTSGDLVRTETVLYGAETLSEEVMFKVKHKVPDGSMTYSTRANDNRISLARTPLLFTDPSFMVTVPVDSSTFENSSSRYPLYDPSATDPAAGSGYGMLKITFLNTGIPTGNSLKVFLCQYHPDWGVDASGQAENSYLTPPCTQPQASAYWPFLDARDTSVPAGSAKTWLLDPSMQQELILINYAPWGTPKNIYVQIEAFTPDGPDPDSAPDAKGIPYSAQLEVVDVNANYSDVSRRIRVQVPNY